MNEVSGKANQLILEACAQRGIPPERLVEGLSIDVERLRDGRRRMDWDLHVALLERLELLCGGPEALEEAGSAVHGADTLRRTRSLGALFLDARRMFWIGCRWIGPSLFSHAIYGYDELDDGRVRMTVEIPERYRASEAFFRITLGALRTTPIAAGYSKPAVVSLDTDGRRAEFLIEPPPRPAFWSLLRRLITLPFAASHAIEELSEQQEALNRSVRELSAAHERIGERELQLETLDALGRQLVHEIETQRVGDGLLESLRTRFGWNGAALWIESRGGESELELLCHSGGDAGPARVHLLRAGGRVVGRLDVWGGDRGDDPVRREVFEKMLPWIAMAVSSAHARQRNGGPPSEFRWTGESGKDLFLIVDADGGIRYASPTIETVLGISPDEAVSLGVTGLVHPEDWPDLEHTFATSLIGPGSAAFSQARVRHGDGSWRVVEGVGIKVLDEHRRDVYLLACSDVTDRQRAH